MDMDQEYIDDFWGPEFWQKVQELADIVRETAEKLGKALREAFAPATESLRRALEDIEAGIVYEPRKNLPRPPRYSGPQNKGRAWNRQPPRLARSCCRKMRR